MRDMYRTSFNIGLAGGKLFATGGRAVDRRTVPGEVCTSFAGLQLHVLVMILVTWRRCFYVSFPKWVWLDFLLERTMICWQAKWQHPSKEFTRSPVSLGKPACSMCWRSS